MKADQVRKIAVLGAGVMGHGIAQIASQNNYLVTIRDIDQILLDSAKKGIEKDLLRLSERGRIKIEDIESIQGRIVPTLSLLEAISDADLVIEAVPERIEVKCQIWNEVSKYAKTDAIFATNTSSLSITEISKSVNNPSRFVGMHFFNPPTIMQLVEIIPSKSTSNETLDAVHNIAKKLGKTPIMVTKDAPGFIVNRILITYLNQAASLLDKGYRKEQIDAAMQKAGMPMGPFILSDLIGIDIIYNILKVFEAKIGSDYAPAIKIHRLFDQKKFGRKTGEGFYNYMEKPILSDAEAQGFDPNILINIMISEAEKTVAEGISDEQTVDTAMKMGANFPYGPFELKRQITKGLFSDEPVQVGLSEGILKITINRPSKLNAITIEMLIKIAETIEKANVDPIVKVITITGVGDKAFSAGADIDELSKLALDEAHNYSEIGHRSMKKIKLSKKPVIALINGFALGGGCELACWCDFRIANEKARFGQTEINLGIIPGWGGTQILSFIVGFNKARDLITTGELIDATEAKNIGLVDRVYPNTEFGTKSSEFIKKLVLGPPQAISAIKQLTKFQTEKTSLDSEAAFFSELFKSNDFKEGITSFKEKRKPIFRGE